MNKFLKISGIIFGSLLGLLYILFLIVTPFVINLDKYYPNVQNFVKNNVGLDISYEKARIFTTPLLEVGVKSKNISLEIPQYNSNVLKIDSFSAKIFLPALLWKSARITSVKIDNPKVNLEIVNGKKFKLAKTYEDLINKQRQTRLENKNSETVQSEKITDNLKIFINGINIKDYNITVDDLSSKHKLTLIGEKLKMSYDNGNFAKLKTETKLLSDNNVNINAKVNINTFLPKFNPTEQDNDDEAVLELPFINPVTMYRDYNLKSDINTKLKIRKDKNTNKIKLYGFTNIENTTVTLAGFELPYSYLNMKSNGFKTHFDTKFYATKDEFLNLAGKIDYGKKPLLELCLKSPQVHLQNLLNITKAYLDAIHIKNDFSDISAQGYFLSNAYLKTNFEDINSEGKIVIRDGKITDKNIGLLLDDIFANIYLDNDIILVKNTRLSVNQNPITFSGKIDSSSIANFDIKGENIPLTGLYKAFMPRHIKNNYHLNSGYLSINSKITGEIKDIIITLKTNLEKINFSSADNTFIVKNDLFKFGYVNNSGQVSGRIKNTGFNLVLPKKNAYITNNNFIAEIDNNKILIPNFPVRFNRKSLINIHGQIEDYLINPKTKFFADGYLNSYDIGLVIGKHLIPYFDIKGFIPIKAKLDTDKKSQKFLAQAKSDYSNYITPINIDKLKSKDTILQLFIEKEPNILKIKNSGLYTLNFHTPFTNDFKSNLRGKKEIISLRATLTNLKTNPFISLFKINISEVLSGSIHIFPKSKFSLSGNIFAFGDLDNPDIRGKIAISSVSVPEISTKIKQISIVPSTRNIQTEIFNVNANNSSFSAKITSDWNLLGDMILSDVKIYSHFIDVNKLLKVTNEIERILPKNNNILATNNNIPLTIKKGDFRIKKIKSDDIILNDTTGKISLYKSILNISNLKSKPMGGDVTGNIKTDLRNMKINAQIYGKNFEMEKVLWDTLKLKDTLTGKLHFTSNLTFRGTDLDTQLKTLNGKIDFSVKNGQLGPFGKLENFIMAENIRQNAFFSSSVGSIITNLVTIDTSRFNNLFGHIIIRNGIADISPIKSQGNVMSMYIFGNANLTNNKADMKIRGKLASAFSDKLGVLSNINPINLVKHTPGLNIAAVKAFTLFCEEISDKEMNAIPELAQNKTDENATKFQVVLKGDTRKPLKMIKSFKWLVLNSEMETAKEFVDTLPVPTPEEENLSVEELLQQHAGHNEK